MVPQKECLINRVAKKEIGPKEQKGFGPDSGV